MTDFFRNLRVEAWREVWRPGVGVYVYDLDVANRRIFAAKPVTFEFEEVPEGSMRDATIVLPDQQGRLWYEAFVALYANNAPPSGTRQDFEYERSRVDRLMNAWIARFGK